ncbi:MAG: hypothetical protein JWP27_3036 [Flaviaesturariibacter sp.]|nr:hypothetical protein [Flaviaesturariibacter sp.]
MASTKNGNSAGSYDSKQDSGGRLSAVTDTARDKLSGLGSTASGTLDNIPLLAVGAGVAIGAVLAAVLPASQREKELLAPLGSKITKAGNGAVDRARDMGKQKFDEMAGDKVREFFGVTSSSSTTA